MNCIYPPIMTVYRFTTSQIRSNRSEQLTMTPILPIQLLQQVTMDTMVRGECTPISIPVALWVSDINNGFFTLKTHFPKVQLSGKIYVAEAGKGIVFKDSLSGYKLMSINTSGAITVTPIVNLQSEHKIDSADVELMTINDKIVLTNLDGKNLRNFR